MSNGYYLLYSRSAITRRYVRTLFIYILISFEEFLLVVFIHLGSCANFHSRGIPSPAVNSHFGVKSSECSWYHWIPHYFKKSPPVRSTRRAALTSISTTGVYHSYGLPTCYCCSRQYPFNSPFESCIYVYKCFISFFFCLKKRRGMMWCMECSVRSPHRWYVRDSSIAK